VRSYVSTARKHGVDPLHALRQLFQQGSPWLVVRLRDDLAPQIILLLRRLLRKGEDHGTDAYRVSGTWEGRCRLGGLVTYGC
jgi:hypothetical protein